MDWAQQRVRCAQGQWSAAWWEHGARASCRPIIVAFARDDGQACPVRTVCTRAWQHGRRVRLPPPARNEALEAARAWYASEEGKPRDQRRAGVEGTLSQGVRRFGLRGARYRGLEKTHFQHVATAAMHRDRLVAWFDERPRAKTRPARFAALAPACGRRQDAPAV